MNADITVVIPCFNYGRFLPDAVTSALSQQGGEPRVIVVDDGSTDPQTIAELERLPSQVTVIRQPNLGVAAARNTGLSRVTTPYAVVLDADDRLTENALADLRVPLDEDPGLGFSFGTMRFFGEWHGVLRMPDYDPYGLLFRHTIGSTALMRRQLFIDVRGYDSAFGGYEDWDFWLGALRHGWRGRRVDAETVLYRRHGATRHFAARARYRTTFRQLRSKYGDLYGREGRRRLAAQSRMGPGCRFVYRFWWGARPVPARVEVALHALLWRAGSAGDAAGSTGR